MVIRIDPKSTSQRRIFLYLPFNYKNIVFLINRCDFVRVWIDVRTIEGKIQPIFLGATVLFIDSLGIFILHQDFYFNPQSAFVILIFARLSQLLINSEFSN
ncbi:hypothetical protein D7Z94_12210 [Ulvibacterium marinum]|uniref:Uncharacterized protein n=1 Tax=Ulvibacterium marinum TaxID=2419782 RepID=A0A3B0C840_9FLAO|nr:hypothetical protein D7Z94_12210 [Ulvibacterium marinum]